MGSGAGRCHRPGRVRPPLRALTVCCRMCTRVLSTPAAALLFPWVGISSREEKSRHVLCWRLSDGCPCTRGVSVAFVFDDVL